MVRFIHTADWQLGEPFARRARPDALRAQRLEAIERIGALADERGVDFVVVAGDVFDANTVARRVVRQMLERLDAYPVPVYLLPGNHDHVGSPNAILESSAFRDARPEHVHVLAAPEPERVVRGEAVLLPAPLQQRHHPEDPTRHLSPSFGLDGDDAVRIGVAHGNVRPRDADGDDTNRIPPDRAELADLDYLALGDWHGTRQIGSRTWYAGTPEPDSFASEGAGYVLDVTLPAPGASPEVERLETGRLTWCRHAFECRGPDDVDRFEAWAAGLDDLHHTLVRLDLEGTLTLEAQERLDQHLEALRDASWEADIRGHVRPTPSPDAWDDTRLEGYLERAVAWLAEAAEGDIDSSDHPVRSIVEQSQYWDDGSTSLEERAERALHQLRLLVRQYER
jgi:3',5'-cyclic AMP phosphodiesterase CpdA